LARSKRDAAADKDGLRNDRRSPLQPLILCFSRAESCCSAPAGFGILGLIDVASRSLAGVSAQPIPPASACASATLPNHPPPAIVLTTTGNTNLDLTMLQRATQLCVAIWQQIVLYDANTDMNNPDLYIDQALPANQAVYGAAVPLPMHLPWPHSPLVPPQWPPMPVAGDPDPPEVD
jgi:hypothetical protein